MSDAKGQADDKTAVYYDGSCPMCTAIVSKVDRATHGANFSMHNIEHCALPGTFTRQDVEKEMHLVDANGTTYKNAAAILKLLEPFPQWRTVVKFGRLPVVKQILPAGYNFVAANRHFLFGPASRVYWLKVLVALGFLFGLSLSPKLWVTSRLFPLTPVIGGVGPIPYPFDWMAFAALFALLAAVAIASKPKPYIWAAAGLVILLALLDQQRLQPWVYEYTFLLAALGLFSWKFDDVAGKEVTLNICRLMIASIYFWSGLQKLNPHFIGDMFPWMIEPIESIFPESAHPVFYVFGMLVPFIEMGIGIGLLVRPFRSAAVWLAVLMCAFVLLTLGPLGHNWNSVVWPWNVTMALLVVLLFRKTDATATNEVVWIKSCAFHKFVLIAFVLSPIAYFFNMWDSYLSWSLYSDTINRATIYTSDRVKSKLPASLQRLDKIIDADDRADVPVSNWTFSGMDGLSVSNWAFTELNVPPYPEARIYKRVARLICDTANDPREVVLVMRGRLSWFFADGPQTMNCSQLR